MIARNLLNVEKIENLTFKTCRGPRFPHDGGGREASESLRGVDCGSAVWSETIPLYYHRIMGISTNKASDMVSDQAVTDASSPHEGQCQLTLSLSIVGLTRNMVSDHTQRYTAIYSHIPSYTAIYSHILPYTAIYSHIPRYTAIYRHIQSYTAIYRHTPSYTAIYRHTPSYTAIYRDIPSYTVIHRHTLPYPVIYSHISQFYPLLTFIKKLESVFSRGLT